MKENKGMFLSCPPEIESVAIPCNFYKLVKLTKIDIILYKLLKCLSIPILMSINDHLKLSRAVSKVFSQLACRVSDRQEIAAKWVNLPAQPIVISNSIPKSYQPTGPVLLKIY